MRHMSSRVLILLLVAACGDAVLCDSSPLVVIQSPALAIDGDSSTEGVQTDVRVRSTLRSGDELELIVRDSAGETVMTYREAASGDDTTVFAGVTVPGPRATLEAIGRSECGDARDSIDVELSDLAVSFALPAADGVVSARDGSVAGDRLTLALCGTVSRTNAAVTVSVDGAAPLAAVVDGASWCHTLTLEESPPVHALLVEATSGSSAGAATLRLGVDLTAPAAAGEVTADAPDRRHVALAWRGPADAVRYIVKAATAPLTDANFDDEGVGVEIDASAAGAREAAVLPARTGTPYWLGVASVDEAGNRSIAAIAGPIAPAFDARGPIDGPNRQQGALAMGAAIAHGRFNDDAFDDLAVAAPTQHAGGQLQSGAVYVYFGGPQGIAAQPSVTITGGAPGALAGTSLAAVPLTSADADDLVIGAPGAAGGDGRLFVFPGGAAFPSGSVTAATAPLQIGASAAGAGWFDNAGLGAAAVAADVDGDGVRDLIASAVRGGGTGGAVIFYGGTVTGSVALSDTDTSGFGGAIVEYMPDPLAQPGRGFGAYLHAVAPTRGPLDTDDDLIIGYTDDTATAGDSVYVVRGNGTRPAASLTQRAFAIGRDVRIDLATIYRNTEFGSQAIAIADENGDGARELVISAYRNLNGAGQVLVIDGDTLGTNGIARTTDPGVVWTTVQGAPGMRLGAALAERDARSAIPPRDDVDGDGLADLIVGGTVGNVAHLFVWFGGSLPAGATSIGTASIAIAGPPTFAFSSARPQGPAGQVRWAGDLNGDGLDDVCWSSPYDNANSLDGGFVVLSDDRP